MKSYAQIMIAAFTIVVGAAIAHGQSAPASAKKAPDAAKGKTLFASTCAACHGPEGKGMPKLGKDLTKSTFVKQKTDDELVAFIKVGRRPYDPLNTTKVDMPPKGGNPALQESHMRDIIAYMRSINKP